MLEETPPDRLRRCIAQFPGITPRLEALQYLGGDAIYAINTVLAYSRLRHNNKRPWGYETLQALKSLFLEETGGEEGDGDDSDSDSDSANPGSTQPSPARQQQAAPTREEAVDAGDALAHLVRWARPLFVHWPLLQHTVESLRQAVQAGSRDGWTSRKLSHRAWKSLLAPTPSPAGESAAGAGRRLAGMTKETFWPPLDKRDEDPGRRLLARLAGRYGLGAWNGGKAGHMLRVVEEDACADAEGAGGGTSSRARLLEGLDLKEVVAGVLLLADRSAEDDRAAQRRKLGGVEALTGVGRGRLVVADRQLNRFFAREARAKGEVLVPGMGDWAKGVFYTKFEGLDGVDGSEGEERDSSEVVDESDEEEEVIRVLRHKKSKAVTIEEVAEAEAPKPDPGLKAGRTAAKAEKEGGPVVGIEEKEEPLPPGNVFSKRFTSEELLKAAHTIWEGYTKRWRNRSGPGLKQIDEELKTGWRKILSLALVHEPFRGMSFFSMVTASAILGSRLQNKPWYLLTGASTLDDQWEVYAALYDHVAMQVRSGNVALDFWFPFDDEFKALPKPHGPDDSSKGRKVNKLTGVELAKSLPEGERELFASYNLLGSHDVFNDKGSGFPKVRLPELNRARIEMARQLIEVSQNELKMENLTPAERHGFELDIKRLRYDIQVLLGARKGELSSQADSGREIKPTPPGFRTNRPTAEEIEELKKTFHGTEASPKRRASSSRRSTLNQRLAEQYSKPYKRRRLESLKGRSRAAPYGLGGEG